MPRVILPPTQYDYPFPGRVIAENVPYWNIQSDPRPPQAAPSPQQSNARLEGFSWTFSDPQNPGAQACHTVLPRPSDVDPAVWAALKQHENAHCNGWPESHLGGFYGTPNAN